MNNNTETKKVYGDLFIDNPKRKCFKFKELPEFCHDPMQRDLDFLGFGIQFEPDDTVIVVRCHSEELGDWQLNYRIQLDERTWVKFPGLFPARLFEGKKEGEKITLHSTVLNVDFELTLN